MARLLALEEKAEILDRLLERSPNYQSQAKIGAVLGGLFCLVATGVHTLAREANFFADSSGFLILWGVVYWLTLMTLIWQLWSGAVLAHRPVLSASLRQVLYGLLPAFLVAAVFTVLLCDDPFKEVLFWLLFYGLGLLGLQHFAPRSVVILGWIFTLTGITGVAILSLGNLPDPSALAGSILMATTFGGYHLIFATVLYLLERKVGARDRL